MHKGEYRAHRQTLQGLSQNLKGNTRALGKAGKILPEKQVTKWQEQHDGSFLLLEYMYLHKTKQINASDCQMWLCLVVLL